MPIIVACPKCTRQLRVADDLVGRKVRCPACDTTFDAVAVPVPQSEPAPIEPWHSLDLELADPARGKKEPAPAEAKDLEIDLGLDAPAVRRAPQKEADPPVETIPIQPWQPPAMELDAPQPADRPGPVGAVEVSKNQEEPAAPRGKPRPRLNDDHDDLRACPRCSRMGHRDAGRCLSCGYRFRGETRAEGDEPHAPVRRDCEPHRGGLILTFGIIAVSTLFVCWPLAPIALVMGLVAWFMGSGDLRKMREGTMDPEGHGMTNAGWICGIVGTALNLLAVLGCGGFIGVMIYSDIQRANRANQPKFRAPQPVKPGQNWK